MQSDIGPDLDKVTSNSSAESRMSDLGVSNNDVDWLARGNSLSQRNKGLRTRPRSVSASAGGAPPAKQDQPSKERLAPIPASMSPRSTSPQPSDFADGADGATGTDSQTKPMPVPVPGRKDNDSANGMPQLSKVQTVPSRPSDVYAAGELDNDSHPRISRRMSASQYSGSSSGLSSSAPSKKSSWLHNLGQRLQIGHHGSPPPPSPSARSNDGTASDTNLASNSNGQQTPNPGYSFRSRANSIPHSQPPAAKGSQRHGQPASPSSSFLDPPRVSSPKLNMEVVPPGKGAATAPAIPSPAEVSTSPKPNAGSLMTKLRRLSTRTSTAGLHPGASASESTISVSESGRVVLNRNHHKKQFKVPELRDALPKRVSFDRMVVAEDPPQQIPSRHPKAGNITVLESGEVTRKTPATTGASTSLYYFPRNYTASARQASQTAHEAAVRVAHSVKTGGSLRHKFLPSAGSVDMATDADSMDLESSGLAQKGLMIDKPTHGEGESHHMGDSFNHNRGRRPSADKNDDGDTDDDDSNASQSDSSDPKFESSTVEEIYTRCCHLREILPIPATLKQIKGKSIPLDIIRMMNPRPTMIEILSFSDFLSIVPVRDVSLDNAVITTEMLKTILWALVRSNHLLRLSLCNVITDDEGWKALCAFLSENESLCRLDLSLQLDSKKCKLKPGVSRSEMDWGLFTEAMKARGGIEELLLNGCMVPAESLEDIVTKGCANCTRLGLAVNDLQRDDLEMLWKWLKQDSTKCQGLDLGGNDLDSCNDLLRKIIVDGHSLLYLSLNSTHLKSLESTSEVADAMSKSAIRFLDLSGNPGLFPEFTPVLARLLPRFSDLRRLHLESSGLTSDDAVRLSEAFAICPKLVHISLLNNTNLDKTAYAALAAAVGLSKTIYTLELDPDSVPSSVQRRLAHYSLINMESMVNGISGNKAKQKEYLSNQELVESGSELASVVTELLSGNKDRDELNATTIADALVERARLVREWTRHAIEKILDKKADMGYLDTESKEHLIKLVFLDGNLEKVLTKYEKDEANRNGNKSLGEPHPMGQWFGFLAPPSVDHQDELQVAPIGAEDSSATLSRSSSTTSLQAKAQEQEEGQFHKIGTFMRDRQDNPSERSGEEIRLAMQKIKDRANHRDVLDAIEVIRREHGPQVDRILRSMESKTSDGIDDATLDEVVNDLAKLLGQHHSSQQQPADSS